MADIYNPNQDIHIDKTTSKIVVKKQQDVNPILEDNKIHRNHINQQKGEFQRIAQIPLIALQIKTKELFGHSNYHSLHRSEQQSMIKSMVNSNEFENFRTGSKRL
jgi:hypothetical protein|tara:strand:- start:713 stop:1027 length:315 start_codon:yes stop_codon:yes gene_type:complete